MRILKWNSVILYVDGDTGEIITANEANRHYRIIKKTKDYDFTTKLAKETKELYQECKITHIRWCTREGSQQRLFND